MIIMMTMTTKTTMPLMKTSMTTTMKNTIYMHIYIYICIRFFWGSGFQFWGLFYYCTLQEAGWFLVYRIFTETAHWIFVAVLLSVSVERFSVYRMQELILIYLVIIHPLRIFFFNIFTKVLPSNWVMPGRVWSVSVLEDPCQPQEQTLSLLSITIRCHHLPPTPTL